MSRLQELIAELCPDGVEYRALGDVCEYPRTRVSSDDLGIGTYISVENLAQDYRGLTGEVATTKPGTAVVAFEPGDVLVGNIRPYLKKVWMASFSGGTNGDVLVFRIRTIFKESLLPEFLKAQLTSDAFIDFDMKFAKGAKMPRGDKKAVLKYRIPVPPIEVQREVVRVLDEYVAAHDELVGLLSKELELQRVSWGLVKRSVLSVGDHVEWATLGDIGKTCMCKRVFKAQTSSKGDIPFYKIGTIGGEPDAFISRQLYNEYRNRFNFPRKGNLIISCSGTIGKTVPYDGEPAYFQDSNLIWIDNDGSVVSDEYLEQWLSTVEWPVTTGGTIGRLYTKNVQFIKIPLLSPPEQKAAVARLSVVNETFDDLLSRLDEEIELRKEEISYTRNQLLHFEERCP